MAKVVLRCPHCGKIAHLEKELKLAKKIFKTYSCGHTVLEDEIQIPQGRDEDWTKLRPYQQVGVEKIEKSNFNMLLADDMGLGKTIQVLYALKCHFDEMTPVICTVKSSLKYQWAVEYMKWVSDDLAHMPYIVTDGDMPILPGFKFYIISHSLLKRKWEELKAVGPKLLIVDESHHFKNSEASRTAALKKLVTEAKIPHRVCTSGTPILNRAPEFFTTLNLIRPEDWYSQAGFIRNWCTTDDRGKVQRIAPWNLERFQEKIKPYFLRREKREVLKDLPPFQRNFRWIEIEDKELKKLYNNELDIFQNFRKGHEQLDTMSLLGFLTKLRRITGLAKIPACVEDTLEFLEFADEESGDKIAIGLHHKAVMQGLKLAFAAKGYGVVTIDGSDSPEAKFAKQEEFRKPQNHILLASTLAAGEGLNLQFCSIAVQLERQWNSSKEEQFEGRFDRFGQIRPTACDYFIARGTVDEYFTAMCEEKRKTVTETLSDSFNVEADPFALRDLAEKCVANYL